LLKLNKIDEKSLISEFNSLSVSEKINRSLCYENINQDNKENENHSNFLSQSLQVKPVINNSYMNSLNLERLKRIENKQNLKLLFNILDNN
jgi:hypothetical protein